MPLLYRKKANTPIEAIQWNGTDEVADEIIEWASKYGVTIEFVIGNGAQNEPWLVVHTIEGRMRAVTGTWIAKGSEDEFWPIKASVFENTYEVDKGALLEGVGEANAS